MTDAAARAAKIRLVVFDVDGVLTDGALHIGAAGEMYKSFNARDGLGIALLRRSGLKTAIITGRTSEIVAFRARELGIDAVRQGEQNKLRALRALAEEYRLTPDEIAYVGDDLIDIPPLQAVGLACAVADAAGEVREIAHFISARPGGRGAAREVAEFILRAQNQWERIIFSYRNEKPPANVAQ